jgi:hypothetical protein
MVVNFGQENVLVFSTFYILLRDFFFMASSVLRNTKNGFLTKILPHNSCYLSNASVFSNNFYGFTHLHLFEWKVSSNFFCEITWVKTLHIELKWDNEFLCNIWLNISSSLVIVWMVFYVYFHFTVYWYNYNFFTNIFFNHLISNFKVGFVFTILFFGFWITLFQVLFAKKTVSISAL